MPDFTVQIHHTVIHYCNITVTAKDEEEADYKAAALCDNPEALQKAMAQEKAEWELDDEAYEIYGVDEA